MTSTWHAPHDVLARFASAPEGLDATTASSVEQHLVTCESCRQAVADAADGAALRTSWDAIANIIDRPQPMASERMLGRLGLPGELSRLVAATAGLRLAWFATVAGLAGLAVLVARQNGSDAAFLVIAPLVPLAAVLVTFLPLGDPAGEAGTATPLHGAALAIRRVVAVLAPTLVLLALAGLAVPHLAGGGAAWVLPGLALAAGTLALSTFVRTTVAAAFLSVGWLSVLGVTRVGAGRHAQIADAAVFATSGQGVALVLVLVAGGTFYARRDRFATLEVTW